MNSETNMFGSTLKNVSRFIELTNHFLDKEVEIILRDERKIKGLLNFFSEEFVIISGTHIVNVRYIVSISIIN